MEVSHLCVEQSSQGLGVVLLLSVAKTGCWIVIPHCFFWQVWHRVRDTPGYMSGGQAFNSSRLNVS